MAFTRIRALISIFLIWVLVPAHASNIYIHTDNLADLQALQSNNPNEIFSVSTNLFALKNFHSALRFEYMTTKRSLQFMDKGENICIVNRIKTKERLAKYIFSRPINLFLGRRLYQKSNAPIIPRELFPNKQINLQRLFKAQPKKQILITEQISYGDILDEQIAKLPESNKLIRYGADQETAIREMFAKGRTDYALLYPQQVFTYLADLKVRSYELESIPPYVLGHLMCAKTPDNKKFIKQINAYLSDVKSSEQLLNIHLNFINPSDKPPFKLYFEQEFNTVNSADF